MLFCMCECVQLLANENDKYVSFICCDKYEAFLQSSIKVGLQRTDFKSNLAMTAHFHFSYYIVTNDCSISSDYIVTIFVE